MKLRHRQIAMLALPLALITGGALTACQGCQTPKPNAEEPDAKSTTPALRLYLLSSVAGALEPCGCSKDELGGMDHLAAFIQSQRSQAPQSLTLTAGPLLFIDMRAKQKHAAQDNWKAEAIAQSMKAIGLTAWAPGYNDWAAGPEVLSQRLAQTGATLLGAGLATEGAKASTLVAVGDLKVGLIGISDPRDTAGGYPAGVKGPAADQVLGKVKAEIASLQGQGAQLLVGIAAMQRGAALRVADGVPELHLLLIGGGSSDGDTNSEQPPPELIGSTLVVETANHAQAVSIVDIHVAPGSKGPLKLADAGGVKAAAQLGDLSRRIRELEVRINGWEKGGKVNAEDLAARKADLARLRQQRDAAEAEQPPTEGSYFRYRVEEVREGLGKDEQVASRMLAYYKRVNEHNKKALADLKPQELAAGEIGYAGVDACTSCHQGAREVWDKTAHGHAYKTLVDGFKEFNLECVGCHVTGYGKPGGSTVTHNAKLQSVQCESCHGPGARHVEAPDDESKRLGRVDLTSCVERCHHPPHIWGFDAAAKVGLVLGPGHGLPK